MNKESLAERVWLNPEEAAQRVGISAEVIRQAAWSGELEAYEKPVTVGRAKGKKRHVFLKIHRDDLDAWVRSTWPRVGPKAT